MAGMFEARLKQSPTSKLLRMKKNCSSKKLNSLTTKDYNFFLGRFYFTSNDGS